MVSARLDIRPLSGVIGARVDNVDLARGLDEATFEALRAALLEHLVVVLPGQAITAAQQLAFARRFGEVEPPHPVFAVVPEQPEVTVIQQDGGASGIYNDIWHTDVTFRERPAMASILHARVLPPAGGDTVWANMYAAYDALSPAIRDALDGLVAIHDFYVAFGASVLKGRGGIDKLGDDVRRYPPMAHPVVRCHPVTGRRALFVNREFTTRIEGLSPVESRHLLRLLFEHSEHPNFQMRHSWQVDDLLMWDNRCTMHLATSNFRGPRRMHRITLLGDRPAP